MNTIKMLIRPIKMRWGSGDNYAYLVTDASTSHSWLVDPAEPKDVEPELDAAGVTLKAIVNTHHHYDHSGGNEYFYNKFKLPVIAGKDSPLVSYTPKDGELLSLGDSVEITAIHTPCHTIDSICYFVQDRHTNEKALITGDTLFTAGCGRFFEGKPSQMDAALNDKIASLPHSTKVYPGHEYTKSNVRFAKTVLTDNRALDELERYANTNEICTGKFTIKDELEFNPFMRIADPQITTALGTTDRVKVMKTLREMKDKF